MGLRYVSTILTATPPAVMLLRNTADTADICYEFIGTTSEAPTVSALGLGFDNCLLCRERCPNDDPSMIVTVTGTTGTINWAGETWDLPTDSGISKIVCPNSYGRGKYGIVSDYDWKHYWLKTDGAMGGDLILNRSFGTFKLGLDQTHALHTLSVSGDKDFVSWFGFASTGTFPNTTSSIFQVGKLTGQATPSSNNYFLTNAWFGSYTTSGITYSWVKGALWP